MEYDLDLRRKNQCGDSAPRPGTTLSSYLGSLDLDRLEQFRCESPYVGKLADEMAARGKLVLVFSLGPYAHGILAKTGPGDLQWMKEFRLWKRYKISRVCDKDRPVLQSTIPVPQKIRIRGASGSKRGPVIGYSEKSLATHRQTCLALESIGWIEGGLTVGKLPMEPKSIQSFQKSCTVILKRLRIPFYAAWEGPDPHVHALVGTCLNRAVVRDLEESLHSAFRRCFDQVPPEKLVMWKKGNPAATVRYIGKNFYRNGVPVKGKGATDWLSWTPCFSHAVPWRAVREAKERLPPVPEDVIKRGMARKQRVTNLR